MEFIRMDYMLSVPKTYFFHFLTSQRSGCFFWLISARQQSWYSCHLLFWSVYRQTAKNQALQNGSRQLEGKIGDHGNSFKSQKPNDLEEEGRKTMKHVIDFSWNRSFMSLESWVPVAFSSFKKCCIISTGTEGAIVWTNLDIHNSCI